MNAEEKKWVSHELCDKISAGADDNDIKNAFVNTMHQLAPVIQDFVLQFTPEERLLAGAFFDAATKAVIDIADTASKIFLENTLASFCVKVHFSNDAKEDAQYVVEPSEALIRRYSALLNELLNGYQYIDNMILLGMLKKTWMAMEEGAYSEGEITVKAELTNFLYKNMRGFSD